jgi:hypothetical protein
MSVTDERDKQVYVLSGNTEDIKPGDRVTLQGKKKSEADGRQRAALLGSKQGNQGLRPLLALEVFST